MATTGLWIWKALKLGAVGGAVYFTVATGVWGKDNKQVLSLVEQLRHTPDEEELKQEELNKKRLGERYNDGVKKFFKYAAESPEKIQDATKSLTEKAMSQIRGS